MAKVEELVLPLNPLDELIDELGTLALSPKAWPAHHFSGLCLMAADESAQHQVKQA